MYILIIKSLLLFQNSVTHKDDKKSNIMSNKSLINIFLIKPKIF